LLSVSGGGEQRRLAPRLPKCEIVHVECPLEHR